VTVLSALALSVPIYTSGDKAEQHLEALARAFVRAAGPLAVGGLRAGEWYPLLIVSPGVARVLSASGLSKDDVRAYLYEHAHIAAWELEECAHSAGDGTFDLLRLVEEGRLPSVYSESSDPQRLVPLTVDPSTIHIVVAGDPGRNQSKFVVQCNAQGRPTTRVAGP
jgi:hypothetical protein